MGVGVGCDELVGPSGDGDAVEPALLHFLPGFGIEIVALQYHHPASDLSLGEVLIVFGFENVAFSHRKLRNGHGVVVYVVAIYHAALGETVSCLFHFCGAVKVALQVFYVRLHNRYVDQALGATAFAFKLVGSVDSCVVSICAFDDGATHIGGLHIIKKERDQIDVHVHQFSLAQVSAFKEL